jgi:hypothetical protein
VVPSIWLFKRISKYAVVIFQVSSYTISDLDYSFHSNFVAFLRRLHVKYTSKRSYAFRTITFLTEAAKINLMRGVNQLVEYVHRVITLTSKKKDGLLPFVFNYQKESKSIYFHVHGRR